MIRELINFTKKIDEDFKNLGIKPRDGLHIMVRFEEIDNQLFISTQNVEFGRYSKKMSEETEFLERCKFLSQNAWCIDTNKCFDLPTKAIHSCSPYLIAFKREHLEGGEKYKKNQLEKKKQLHERFGTYFSKANLLLNNDQEIFKNKIFEFFFSQGTFIKLFDSILEKNETENERLTNELNILSQQFKDSKDKDEREAFKSKMLIIESQILHVKPLEDSDYVCFYLDKSIEEYKGVHQKYLADKLFNTEKYNTKPNEEGQIFGTSNFMNGFNSNMPFLTHQSATFEITGRISDEDAKLLFEFQQILPRKILPNPLPIFIYDDEMQGSTISHFKGSGFKLGYKEIIEELNSKHKRNIENYHLLQYANTKDGLVFHDFDFVSKFEYEFDAQIENLFEILEKGGKNYIYYPKIGNVFQLEQTVFKPLLQSKYLKVDYFNDLKSEDYEGLPNTFQSLVKYRKSVYDFVYKSKRQGIDGTIFFDMIFSHIKDDLKQNNGYSIKEKLNIWYSLYEKFNSNNKNNHLTMANQLKNYQDFVAQLSMNKVDTATMTDKQFAFAAGQVIEYVLQKSKAEDRSYQLLEPYLQQAKCQEFKRAISNDVARYKHAIKDNEYRFRSVCDAVLAHETDANLKDLMPEILSGVFSKCQFYHKDEDKKQENN